MKTIRNILITLLFTVFVQVTGYSQRQTQKVIEEAISKGQYKIVLVRDSYRAKDYFHPHYDILITINSCDIDKSDFDGYFRKNPQYAVDEMKSEQRLKYGDFATYVKKFSICYRGTEAAVLQEYLRLYNKKKDLQLPSFHDIREANDFFLKYIKPHSDKGLVKELYLKVCSATMTEYLRGNRSRIEEFCAKSPYKEALFFEKAENSEGYLLSNIIDVKSILNSALTDVGLVFFMDDKNGFINRKADKYYGEIKNGKADGNGTLWVNDGKWTGEFKDGYRNGSMTHEWSMGESYQAVNGKTYDHQNNDYLKKNKLLGVTTDKRVFGCEESGTYRVDHWVGTTQYKVGLYTVSMGLFSMKTYNQNLYDKFEKHYDSNGQLVSTFTTSQSLTWKLETVENNYKVYLDVRVPSVVKRYYSDCGISLTYADGVYVNCAYYYDDDGRINLGFRDADEAERYCYVRTYGFDNLSELVKRYGLPQWR